MEDALVHKAIIGFERFEDGLNPCFNGRCTRTKYFKLFREAKKVLILVLMEDALVPAFMWL